MISYMINFGVYTMAMVGLLAGAVVIYKKSTGFNSAKKSTLKIDDKIALNARKSLYVVNAGGERFLIAGDIDNTSLIAKLGQTGSNETVAPVTNPVNFADELSRQAKEFKPFISREEQPVKLREFKTEVSDADKSLNKAFDNVVTINTEKYLDVKNIRKKPVMKELARKLAQI